LLVLGKAQYPPPMRKAELAVLFAIVLLPVLASAQNEWIEADPFNMAQPELVAVERWDGWGSVSPGPIRVAYAAVERIKLFYNEGSMNLSLSLRPDKSYFLLLKPKQVIRPGTSTLVFDTKEKLIGWGGSNYQTYLSSVGLDDVAKYRLERHIQDARVQARTSSHYKTVIQVGGTIEPTPTRADGQPLEFVLLKHPFNVALSETLEIQLLFQGKPLAGRVVQAESHGTDGRTKQVQRTDERGIARIALDNRGKWILSATYVIPPDKTDGEWREYRGALTFKHP